MSVAACSLGILLMLRLAGQDRASPRSTPTGARVEVVAYREDDGRLLGAPQVQVFESADGENLASRFRGGVADGIPFGVYRIEARLPAYTADGGFVSIYQPRVTLVVGLAVGYELPIAPAELKGHVIGGVPKGSFVKLVGIYNSRVMESAIEPDGSFGFTGLTHGRFLMMVIAETGLLAERTVIFGGDGIRSGDSTQVPKGSAIEIQLDAMPSRP
jgi:hypothetical protein